MNKNVWIISRYLYPEGDAGAIRSMSFAKMYNLLGYNVYMFGFGDESKGKLSQQICYQNFLIPRSNFFEKLSLAKKYNDIIHSKILNNNKVKIADVIHVVDIPAKAMRALEKFAENNDIKLIHDSVEWYSACEFKMGYISSGYILKNYLNKHVINSNYQVIAISSYLENYFVSKGINSIRIPVILDIKNTDKVKNVNDGFINIGYAGAPGKKDSLDCIVRGYIESLHNNCRTRLHIIGVTYDKFISINKYSNIEKELIRNSVSFYGRVSHSKVVEILCKMNYTILVRPAEERYAKAGFPTKVVESMSLGIPVICNYSSDLNKYLKDMVNSVIVEDNTVESVKKAMLKIQKVSYSEWENISYKARKTALDNFDYRNYISQLELILK